MNDRASPDLSLLLPEPTPGEIVAARQRAGHTQAQAAHAVGLGSNMRWSEYERGVRSPDMARWALYLLLTDQHPAARAVRRKAQSCKPQNSRHFPNALPARKA